jgi:hypothetical protein
MLKWRALALRDHMSDERLGFLQELPAPEPEPEGAPDQVRRAELLNELRVQETRIGLRAIGSPISGDHNRRRILELEHELDQRFAGWRRDTGSRSTDG